MIFSKDNWLEPKFYKQNKEDKKEICLIDRAVQREIDAGVPFYRRTRAWFISCPCSKCSPFTL